MLVMSLHEIIQNGSQDKFDAMLKSRLYDINEKNKRGMTPLESACKSGNIYAVKKLLSYSNIIIDWQKAVNYACKSANIHLAKYLLDDPKIYFNINIEESLKHASKKDTVMIEYLLSKNSKIHSLDLKQMLAVVSGMADMPSQEIIDAFANKLLYFNGKLDTFYQYLIQTIIDKMVRWEIISIVKLLLPMRGSVQFDTLTYAILHGSREMAKLLLTHHGNYDNKTKFYEALINSPYFNGNMDDRKYINALIDNVRYNNAYYVLIELMKKGDCVLLDALLSCNIVPTNLPNIVLEELLKCTNDNVIKTIFSSKYINAKHTFQGAIASLYVKTCKNKKHIKIVIQSTQSTFLLIDLIEYFLRDAKEYKQILRLAFERYCPDGCGNILDKLIKSNLDTKTKLQIIKVKYRPFDTFDVIMKKKYMWFWLGAMMEGIIVERYGCNKCKKTGVTMYNNMCCECALTHKSHELTGRMSKMIIT